MNAKVAFNTANLVGRVTGYRFKMSDWGKQHDATMVATDEREWASICRDISDAGFTAVEVWLAHVDPRMMDEAKARAFGRIMADHGLAPIALAGTLTEATARVCNWLNIPQVAGGLWGTDLASVDRLVASTGIRYGYENHPEKSVAEILSKVEGAGPGVGLAVDTGWLVTQGLNPPETIRALGKRVTHVHVKDCRAGSHETVPLGTGAADVLGIISALKSLNYTGWYSWEDEPEARNPLDIASEMCQTLERAINA